MELIPILSTIILVATISTFILAVGAYILFKIREGKAQKQPVIKHANLQAEYIVPKHKQTEKIFVEDIVQTKPKRTILEDRYKQFTTTEEAGFQRQTMDNEKRKELNVEIPKQKYVNVQTLDSPEEQNEYNSGEIKWR
jgi:hypothetical protein